MPSELLQTLKDLAELSNYINTCPSTLRNLLVTPQIKQREALREQDHRYPEIEMRWLYFHLKSLEEKTEADKIIAYATAAIHCEHVIPDFVKEHSETIKDPDELKKLIKDQRALIFKQYLSESITSYLNNYQNDMSKTFSEQDILKNALTRFQHAMYREALHDFETICLIERQHFLNKRKESEQRDYVTGFMTIATSINPELNFLKDRLEQDDLSSFKLYGTRSLFFALGDLTDFSKENLQQKISDFFDEEGDENIDERVSDLSFSSGGGNNIKKRSFNEYFNNQETHTSCTTYMSQAHTELDEFLKTVHIPQSGAEPVATKNKELVTLRELVAEYQNVLEEIVAQEQYTYQDRSQDALNRRQHAIDTLAIMVNQVDTLTDTTRHIAVELVKVIQTNEPTWLEHSIIDMILDFITRPTHAWHRYCMFQKPEQETKLYDAVLNKQEDESSEDIDVQLHT